MVVFFIALVSFALFLYVYDDNVRVLVLELLNSMIFVIFLNQTDVLNVSIKMHFTFTPIE